MLHVVSNRRRWCKYAEICEWRAPKKKILNPGYSHSGSCTADRWQNSEGLESQNVDTPVGINSFCWFVSAVAEMDSDNWGWCWLNMKGSYLLDRYYLVGIQGYGAYSFPPQCAVSFSTQSNTRNIHQNPPNMRCISWQCPVRTAFHSTLLCLSYLILRPASHPPLTFLLQSISVLPACDKRGSKVPATDQMLGNEDASSACPPACDFDGDWPSRWAGRSTSLS